MPHHPYPDVILPYIVEQMIRETVKVAAPQPAGIEMEKTWIFSNLEKPHLEFSKEIFREFFGNLRVFFQDVIQVFLDLFMKPNSHGSEGRKQVGQK